MSKEEASEFCFKPCYKWITFNTQAVIDDIARYGVKVLNLVINGLPSIHDVLNAVYPRMFSKF